MALTLLTALPILEGSVLSLFLLFFLIQKAPCPQSEKKGGKFLEHVLGYDHMHELVIIKKTNH